MSRSLDLRLGGGFGLAATWDHLGLFFPFCTSGVGSESLGS